MAAPAFCHLHVHTHYSLLDGATRISDLVTKAKASGMSAVAITDHGNMFGAIEFYEAAKKAGIKPIIGCETYMAPGDRRTKEARGMKEASNHLLLLAMNRTGYRNLIKLASIAYREGFYYRPRIDKEVLREFSEGLLCTSTCLGGEIPQALIGKNRRAAEEIAKTYLSIFGPDRFFIELQDHGLPEQKALNPELADLAGKLGVAVIATNDVHYLDRTDAEAQDVLCCISTGKLVAQEDRMKFATDQFYLKTPEEMAELFADREDALANTARVADLCDLELDFSKRYAPVYHPPEERTPADYLREKVDEGARQRYGRIDAELRQRIDYELGVISSKGFASYFLIVWDFVQYARAQGIPCGARGSGCSSVVSYCLGISSVDPIRYGLYFERFMDPDRDEMPDIDVDICQVGRAQVLEYVRKKYGHVAQIITFGTLKARQAVKDVARVMGYSFEEAAALTKLIPNELKMTIDKAVEQEPELKALYEREERMRRVIDVARRLEGLARHASVHAAGVVIADQPLDNFLPLYQQSGEDQVVTQFEGNTVEKIGLLKMDFLGLRNLTSLERARQLVACAVRSGDQPPEIRAGLSSARTGPEILITSGLGSDGDTGAGAPPRFVSLSNGRGGGQTAAGPIDLESLDLNDQKVYELFARGETKGIFQFESGGMRDVLMRMRPNRIEDLIAANALYRPGPMVNIDAYVARKHGEAWTTPHPIMTEVLRETYGIMVYQEQVSRLVNRLGGLELKRAFRLAKLISKKKTSAIEAEREPFLAGCEKNGVDRATATTIFEDILRFGGYAFNKAHSAGYALVAFQTAYMKTYHPVEFMAAVMTFEMDSTERIVEYIEECRRAGIRVMPPDINSSQSDFTVEHRRTGILPVQSNGDAPSVIRFGLAAVKGVGEKAMTALAAEREKGGPFKSLFDLCERMDLSVVNRATLEALVASGAFDSTGAMRKALADVLERAMEAGQEMRRDRLSGQLSLFGGAGPEEESIARPEVSLSSQEWTDAEMLAREKAVLGFYVTRHPLAGQRELIESLATAATTDLAACAEGTAVVLGGMVSGVRTVVTKSGRNPGSKLGIVTFADLKGQIEAILFPEMFASHRAMLAPDAILFLVGQVDRRREEPSLRVSEVITPAEALSKLASYVLLRIDEPAANDRALSDLLTACRRHPGKQPIYLDIATGDEFVATLDCPGVKVEVCAALVQSLTALLGAASVMVFSAARKPIPLPEDWIKPQRLQRPLAPPPRLPEPALAAGA